MRSTTRALLNRTDRSAVDWCGRPLLSALPRVRVQMRVRVHGSDGVAARVCYARHWGRSPASVTTDRLLPAASRLASRTRRLRRRYDQGSEAVVRVTIPENVTKRQLSIDFKPQRVTLLIEGEQVIHGDVEYELDAVYAHSRRPSAGHWWFVQWPRSTFAPRRGCQRCLRHGMQRPSPTPDVWRAHHLASLVRTTRVVPVSQTWT